MSLFPPESIRSIPWSLQTFWALKDEWASSEDSAFILDLTIAQQTGQEEATQPINNQATLAERRKKHAAGHFAQNKIQRKELIPSSFSQFLAANALEYLRMCP